MTAPPRTAELILHALGAQPDFRDDVVGDLAEEFALRAAWDGERAARRWYWREAARVAPHLLADWARGVRGAEVTRLAGIAVSAYVLVAVPTAFLFLAVGAVLNALGAAPYIPPLFASTAPLLPAAGLTFGAIVATAGGAVAASLDRKAPLVGAFALGAVWSCLIAVVQTLAGPAPAWYRLGVPVVVMLGTAAGGVLRVRAARPVSGVAAPASRALE